MKKHLLKQSGSYYKAGMHIHTTVSDGKYSPEEVKAYYQDLGYSILAFTDHEVFVPHNDLSDESFIALNSIEIDLNENHNGISSTCKCAHLNLYAKDPSTTVCPLFRKSSAMALPMPCAVPVIKTFISLFPFPYIQNILFPRFHSAISS